MEKLFSPPYYSAMAPPNLLTVKQAADARGVTKAWILKLIRDRRLKAEMVGIQYLIKPADLDKLEVRDRAGRPPAQETAPAPRRARKAR